MNKLTKLGVTKTLSWAAVAIVMVIIFSNKNAILNWGDNQIKTILLAVLIAFGLFMDLVIRTIIKRGRQLKENQINYKNLNVEIIATLLYIFIIIITLYIYYESAGAVPVGWLWFIAYSTIVFVDITFGVCDLLFNQRR
ncbi:MAG TPA: hypothetical protein VJ916_03285 [Anaerovoracaceae bacterium]|nr:hypothetical protein [Anaerovoracaceae bacterium]